VVFFFGHLLSRNVSGAILPFPKHSLPHISLFLSKILWRRRGLCAVTPSLASSQPVPYKRINTKNNNQKQPDLEIVDGYFLLRTILVELSIPSSSFLLGPPSSSLIPDSGKCSRTDSRFYLSNSLGKRQSFVRQRVLFISSVRSFL